MHPTPQPEGQREHELLGPKPADLLHDLPGCTSLRGSPLENLSWAVQEASPRGASFSALSYFLKGFEIMAQSLFSSPVPTHRQKKGLFSFSEGVRVCVLARAHAYVCACMCV